MMVPAPSKAEQRRRALPTTLPVPSSSLRMVAPFRTVKALRRIAIFSLIVYVLISIRLYHHQHSSSSGGSRQPKNGVPGYISTSRAMLSISNPDSSMNSNMHGGDQKKAEVTKNPPILRTPSRQVHNLSNETNDEPSVLVVTYVFGEQAANKRYLRLFVESAARSGIDVAIVGDPPLPSSLISILPPNVHTFTVTWDQLVDRVRDRVFNGIEPANLRRVGQNKNYYKIIDFKPLTAHLWPELVQNYTFWGHVDNDMVLGNMGYFLQKHNRLWKYDVITHLGNEYTSGPFTLYRNTAVLNQLFRLAERPPAEIWDTDIVRVFDEWGGGFAAPSRNNRDNDDSGAAAAYRSTMSGILERHGKRLGVRWFGGIPAVWDGFCRGQRTDGFCSACTLKLLPGQQPQQQLTQDCFGRRPCHHHVAFCHFEFSKNTMEESLLRMLADEKNGNEDQFELLRLDDDGAEQAAGLTLHVNFLEGFTRSSGS